MSYCKLKKSADVSDVIVVANASGSTRVAGTPFVLEKTNLKGIVVIPVADIANGSSGAAWIRGEFTVNKNSSVTLGVASSAYWDVSANEATTSAVATTDGDFVLGSVIGAAGSGQTWVDFHLNFGPDAYTVIS